MSQYEQMWTDLGLDLPAHDALLGFLNNVYGDLFLSQKERPDGMKYFDFVMSEVHGLRIKELVDAKAEGRKVVGSYCTFVPEEMVLAVDAISVGLCAGADFATEKVEQLLPRNTCALIKSAFGFKLGKVCPYVEACDLIVGENTCDGKKKAYEILGGLLDGMHVIDLPHVKSEAGRALLKQEYMRFADALEELTGRKITVENLKRGIAVANSKRQALKMLSSLRGLDPSPISGLDALLASQVSFYDDPVRFTESVEKICDELVARGRERKGVFPAGTPRLLVSGCPMAVPNWKLHSIVESSGAVIVGEESCVGERSAQWLTSDSGDSMDELIDNLVDRYMKIDCAVFSPNPTRIEHIKQMVRDYKADGVIHYSLQFCQPYQIEAGPIENELENEGIPVLRIDTDYSAEDAGQIRTRVEAFIDRVGAR